MIFLYLPLLQLAHGADPFLKNQEGQTPVDLASADDVRSLLQDAMATHPSAPDSQLQATAIQQSETVVMPSGASVLLPIPYFRGDGCTAPVCSIESVAHSNPAATNIPSFLNRCDYCILPLSSCGYLTSILETFLNPSTFIF